MKVKMLKKEKGSTNGIDVKEYVKDKEYNIPESLAQVFIQMGSAALVTEVKEETKKIKIPKLGNVTPPNNKVNKTPNTKGKGKGSKNKNK
jgi:uncharacterized protein (UPF0128 family)